jgi:hypothetical protein
MKLPGKLFALGLLHFGELPGEGTQLLALFLDFRRMPLRLPVQPGVLIAIAA